MHFMFRREPKIVIFLVFSFALLLQCYHVSRSWGKHIPLDLPSDGVANSENSASSEVLPSPVAYSAPSDLSTNAASDSSATSSSDEASATVNPPSSEENDALITAPFGAIVTPMRLDQDMTWLDGLKDRWKIHIYNVDDTSAEPRVPQNKGHEAMVYLTYIIDNYDYSLPGYIIFIHGHAQSWHQEDDIIPLIRSIRLSALQTAGYVPLRCDWYPSCAAELKPIGHNGTVWGPGVHRADAEYAISEVWDTFFPGVSLPETISSQCCAQFAVTRETIKKRRKEDYINFRRWLLETELIDDVSGRVLEKLWAYIMTGEPVQ
ncbi:hypothetical protein MMC11_007243 [Xylographa trunciseda]|nr:hypothetical protein [Xylographa trunciseda]